jgi:hypothetical protein
MLRRILKEAIMAYLRFLSDIRLERLADNIKMGIMEIVIDSVK